MCQKTETTINPKDIIELLVGAVPEREREIRQLWGHYNPKLVLVNNAHRITLDANKERIQFDIKTMDVFWLIGFSGWKAIECYSPLVIASAHYGRPIAEVITADTELDEVERDYKERRACCQNLIDAKDPTLAAWPDDIPRPGQERSAFEDVEFKAAFDLTCIAVAFTFFHEFRHVMLDHDEERPEDVREEEMFCDVWARDFMTARVATYASEHNHDYAEVLRKRSMGLALSALIIHEITPELYHGGSRSYFSTYDRLRAILDNTSLPDEDHFWVFSASLLIGIFRRRTENFDTPSMSPKALGLHLLKRLGAHSEI